MNSIAVSGTLVQDAVVRQEGSVSLCQLRIAVDWYDRNREKQVTTLVDAAASGKLAEICARLHLKQGTYVMADGALETVCFREGPLENVDYCQIVLESLIAGSGTPV